ncbi:hypothetical protein SFRURICE_007187 [Spodoptera frugiperda]|nr:hypothetical protein SFRURICE_007187 [Spodoptera frugiperda]
MYYILLVTLDSTLTIVLIIRSQVSWLPYKLITRRSSNFHARVKTAMSKESRAYISCRSFEPPPSSCLVKNNAPSTDINITAFTEQHTHKLIYAVIVPSMKVNHTTQFNGTN